MVVRILWYMLKERKKKISDVMDIKFVRDWISNVVLGCSRITRHSDRWVVLYKYIATQNFKQTYKFYLNHIMVYDLQFRCQGDEILFKNCGSTWDLATKDPPSRVVSSLRA